MSEIDKLAQALSKAQNEFKSVQKTGRNPHLKNEYATLDDIINAVRPSLCKYGLSFVQLLGSDGAGVTSLKTLLMHESGQWLEANVAVDSSEQRGVNALQSLGAAITYMKRYSLSAMLGIAADVDTDGEGTSAKPQAKAEPEPKLAPAAKPMNGHGRPLDADKIRDVIRKKAGWQGDKRKTDGEPITEKQVPYTATLMAELFPNLDNDMTQKARHDALHYLLGADSTKDLTKAEASALIDWMNDQDAARTEAARILEAIALDAGQQKLDL